MKCKFLYVFICSIVVAFALAVSVFAYGYLPPSNPNAGVDVISETVHGLRDVDVLVLDGAYPTAIFSFDYFGVDYQSFFDSDYQTFSEYMGWQEQLDTQGTWLNSWVYQSTNLYSNWFTFSLTVNEALGNWRRSYELGLENDILTSDNDVLNIRIEALVDEIEYLENELARGGTWQDGYNAGITDGENVTNGILTIFTAPLTFLSGWFNFTIFGINFASLIKFFVSLALVTWLFKKLKTESE